MEVKIIFFDVDGTLLSFDTHQVPVEAAEAVRRAHLDGVKIIIATGRAFNDLEELGDLPYDGIAALNGAECVLKDGTHIVRHQIGPEDFGRMVELSEKYDFPVVIVTGEGNFVNRLTPAVEGLARLVNHPVPPVADLWEVYRREGTCQLCIYCTEDVQERIMAGMPSLTVSRWNPYFADVNAAGVDKAAGVREFCSFYGFDVSQAAAIGDGGNDIPMLRAAGVGIAMGNASDAVKAAADFVTNSVDDGGLCSALARLGLR